MNILALDTSTEFLSLALQKGEQVFVRELNAGQTHSQRILPLLRELLNEANVALADLGGIAFGAGPGSFTGLRIACGVAQGLAYGANLPVVGVSTLLAVAEETGSNKVIVCLDARMSEVYHAAYEKVEGQWKEVVAPNLSKPEMVATIAGQDWTAAGSGWQVFASQLNAVYGNQVSEYSQILYPSAKIIAQIAQPMFLAGQGVTAAEAHPIYIRNKVALKTHERSQ
jgi:tRNA threonylcarbamoyladenosine biosynthesis protein TsaB